MTAPESSGRDALRAAVKRLADDYLHTNGILLFRDGTTDMIADALFDDPLASVLRDGETLRAEVERLRCAQDRQAVNAYNARTERDAARAQVDAVRAYCGLWPDRITAITVLAALDGTS
jgi:hypothetical protein